MGKTEGMLKIGKTTPEKTEKTGMTRSAKKRLKKKQKKASNKPATPTKEHSNDEIEMSESDHEEKKKLVLGSNAGGIYNEATRKYYQQRYSLFSNFDDGIILDEESWYSVTPEILAKHTAQRCKSGVILDVFGGAGGNTIQFSQTCGQVYHVDIDPLKTELASHNYKVMKSSPGFKFSENIHWINADGMDVVSNFKNYLVRKPGAKEPDVIYLSPPWGGPNYIKSDTFSLNDMTPNGFDIFRKCLALCKNIVYFLPKNTCDQDIEELVVISKESGGSDSCELEENYLNNSLKSITLYFGPKFQKQP